MYVDPNDCWCTNTTWLSGAVFENLTATIGPCPHHQSRFNRRMAALREGDGDEGRPASRALLCRSECGTGALAPCHRWLFVLMPGGRFQGGKFNPLGGAFADPHSELACKRASGRRRAHIAIYLVWTPGRTIAAVQELLSQVCRRSVGLQKPRYRGQISAPVSSCSATVAYPDQYRAGGLLHIRPNRKNHNVRKPPMSPHGWWTGSRSAESRP